MKAAGVITVEPAAGRHAIEVMSLAVEWARPVEHASFERAREAYSNSADLQRFFPDVTPIQTVTIRFDEGLASAEVPASGGLQFTQKAADGSHAWLMVMRPEFVSCTCRVYDRWQSTKPQAMAALMPIVDLVLPTGNSINAVGLQYQDMFRVNVVSPRIATGRLLELDSRWLPRSARDEDGPWHLHQGWFSTGENDRLVHNLLNVDLVKDGDACLFRINGQHRQLAMNREEKPIPLDLGDISRVFDELHVLNKRVLYELLSKSICSQIGLTV